ncbi:hypothetical protein [Paenibacillus sp. J2TS4]|uniref:hypothetical protein n=1 Tax=Paenibacillus sp. J2TS4 TaxID=2807194 RepID=UPI001BD16941|nr:hypothetical protein [Paenibacillus sp. J2TS4]
MIRYLWPVSNGGKSPFVTPEWNSIVHVILGRQLFEKQNLCKEEKNGDFASICFLKIWTAYEASPI